MQPSVTYRVQDLPRAVDSDSVTELIEAAVGLNQGCSDLKVHSLATDPYYSNKKTATITSKDLAYVLPEAAQRDRWAFDPPGWLGGSANALTIDTHFLGFTPLNSFDDDSKHHYE